ncbi:hypothetical protein CJA_3285 [Cellvibrio japonicus Ueda107]|uniref:Uncharacterized protein n=1 Tax=Cellvibrio japonicus (strain Ueda107) TaxID=498211 RepID=B3PEI3_CELJU|nr:hypothetical protein CJA_3285 [Cellvibrio japonicus Ueda107]
MLTIGPSSLLNQLPDFTCPDQSQHFHHALPLIHVQK